MKLFSTLLLLVFFLGLKAQYVYPEDLMSPPKKLSISNTELIASGILFAGGLVVPRLMDHTQGLEVPMFVFGLTLGIEGIRLRNTIPNIKHARMERRIQRIRRK